MWVYNHPGGEVLFEWHTGRGGGCLKGMLQKFRGHVQSDGYVVYASFAKEHGGIQLSACWAHARRKFDEAAADSPVLVRWLLHQIRLMYRIEDALRGKGPNLRQAVRDAQTAMILARIGKVRSNLMIDLNPANVKLRDRAVRIVRELSGADYRTAQEALERSGWVVKKAVGQLSRRRSPVACRICLAGTPP